MHATKASVRSVTLSGDRHDAREPGSTPPGTDRPIEDVWREFRRTRSEDLRNALIEHYLPLVRSSAERYVQKLPRQVDVEDLYTPGCFGLIEAVNKYDPDRNIKFETFSAMHIRGAIIDELRVQDWVPRLPRARQSMVDKVRQRIYVEHGRHAKDEEVAAHLDLESDEAGRVLGDCTPTRIVSITRERYGSDGESDTRDIDIIKDDTQQDPVRSLQRKDLRELVTKGLSRAERLIVVLYYYEGMTMKEVGATLDLSESRVSQMHSLIVRRLKSQMQHRARELEPID